MTLVQRIQKLCDSKNTTLIGLEREVGIGRGTIRKWDEVSPSIDKLQKVADYFNVTSDYLLGRSARCIIDEKLEEKNMTLEDLSSKTGVPLHWLKNLETFIPGSLGYGHEISYEWITKVAEVLELSDKKLRATLARQEIPSSEYPEQVSTIAEDFSVHYTEGHLASHKSTEYDEPLTEDERAAVKAFLEAYRKMKQNKEDE